MFQNLLSADERLVSNASYTIRQAQTTSVEQCATSRLQSPIPRPSHKGLYRLFSLPGGPVGGGNAQGHCLAATLAQVRHVKTGLPGGMVTFVGND